MPGMSGKEGQNAALSSGPPFRRSADGWPAE